MARDVRIRFTIKRFAIGRGNTCRELSLAPEVNGIKKTPRVEKRVVQEVGNVTVIRRERKLRTEMILSTVREVSVAVLYDEVLSF